MRENENTTENNLSRRSFLQGAGLGTLAVAGAGILASCGNDSDQVANDAETAITWDSETDVAVIGSGTAGLVSAITMFEENPDIDVKILEKTDFIGGVSGVCVQMCAFDSKLDLKQPVEGVADSAELMLENMIDVSEHTLDPALAKIICDNSADAVNWIADLGVEFLPELKIAECRDGQGKYIMQTAGDHVQRMLEKVNEKTEIMGECSLQEIFRDKETGKITGISYTDPSGNVHTMGTRKGVIICSGMWSDDETMLQRHRTWIPDVPKETAKTFASFGMPYGPYTGEAIQAAMKVGAATRGMEHFMIEPYFSISELMSQGVAVAGIARTVYQVLVSSDGKRFTNEGGRGAIGEATFELPDQTFYPILDSRIMEQDGNPSPEVLEEWITAGHVVKGHTYEELAAQMEEVLNIPQDAVLETLNTYASYCAEGIDPEFNKNALFLAPLDTPPYYAGPATTALVFYTHGGLDADENARVRDIEGNVIPGLYAAGMCTGGKFGKDTVSGNWQTGSIVFGRIAGKNIVSD